MVALRLKGQLHWSYIQLNQLVNYTNIIFDYKCHSEYQSIIQQYKQFRVKIFPTIFHKQHANTNSPTELYCLFWRHLDVTTLHCSLLLNSWLIKVDFKPFDSWGCFVPDILFEIVDKFMNKKAICPHSNSLKAFRIYHERSKWGHSFGIAH